MQIINPITSFTTAAAVAINLVTPAQAQNIPTIVMGIEGHIIDACTLDGDLASLEFITTYSTPMTNSSDEALSTLENSHMGEILQRLDGQLTDSWKAQIEGRTTAEIDTNLDAIFTALQPTFEQVVTTATKALTIGGLEGSPYTLTDAHVIEDHPICKNQLGPSV